jgi:hypothetical protein
MDFLLTGFVAAGLKKNFDEDVFLVKSKDFIFFKSGVLRFFYNLNFKKMRCRIAPAKVVSVAAEIFKSLVF